MEKKTVKTFVNIIVGIALLIIIYSFFLMLFNAITARDPLLMSPDTFNSSVKETLSLAIWMMVSLACLIVPTLVCYGFSLFGKNKIMTLASAVMSLFIALICFSFFFALRDNAFTDINSYTIATAAFTDIIQLFAACTITCAFFTYESVLIILDYRKTHSKNTAAVTEQKEKILLRETVNAEEANENEEN